jgi:hypothetical protein
MSNIRCYAWGALLPATGRLLILCLLNAAIAACHRELTEPVNYDTYSSVVGREGKKLTFFADPRNIPDVPISLYPTLIFEPQTFNEPSVIRLDVQKMSFSSLPPALTPLSVYTCKWGILSSNTLLNKPFQIIIPYELPDTSLWLENYQQQLKLYKLPLGTETTHAQNWTPVTDAILDVNSRTLTAAISDFNYAYCVLFGEILRHDNIALSTRGTVNTTQSGVNTQYFSSTNSQTLGFHYRNNISSYYYEGLWNEDFSVGFSFIGNSTGTYQGNAIQVTYRYKKSGNAWLHQFQATPNTTITITEYNEIGGSIKGRISGELANARAEKITFMMDFNLIRTR